jgi:serine/threonine protein phosphatase PrpC
MPAAQTAQRIVRRETTTHAKDGSRPQDRSQSSPTDIDNTLGHWEKFLAKQPGCDTGFVAAPGQAMRAINVSSAAQVPMILRELHRGDGTIRINFPESTNQKVTQDQVKIRAFLQGHHGKDLASLKGELVKLLKNSDSFNKLEENKTFKRSFASADDWIDANFSGVASDSLSLDVTDVVSVKGKAGEQEAHVTGVIASLQQAVTAGRGAVVTISHDDARDDGLRGVIREKLGQSSEIDCTRVKVWIGAEAGALDKEQPSCDGIRELTLAEFLTTPEKSPKAAASAATNDLIVGSSPARSSTTTSEERLYADNMSQLTLTEEHTARRDLLLEASTFISNRNPAEPLEQFPERGELCYRQIAIIKLYNAVVDADLPISEDSYNRLGRAAGICTTLTNDHYWPKTSQQSQWKDYLEQVRRKLARESQNAEPARQEQLEGHLPSIDREMVAAPAQVADVKIGVAVDNHRPRYGQEDRHLVRSFPTMDSEQAIEYLRHTVTRMDEVTKNNDAGSTFTGVIVTKDGNFVTAHLGDSPASAVIIGKDGKLKEVVALTKDHKPGNNSGTSPSGKEYYEEYGYRYLDDGTGVAMTRALGDAHFEDVLSHEPELHVHDIQAQLQEGERLFLLVTSDGAHNKYKGVTHGDHGVTIADQLQQGTSLTHISQMIASNSEAIRDNVTVALLEVEKGKGAIVAVFDGHGGSETSDQAQSVLHEITEQFAQEAEQVALQKRYDALTARLDDAAKLRGDFLTGAGLMSELISVQREAKAAKKMRKLQRQLSSVSAVNSGQDVERPQKELEEICKELEIYGYGDQGSTLDQKIALFRSDLANRYYRIEARISQYEAQVLLPAIASMRSELLELQNKLAARRVDNFQELPAETHAIKSGSVAPESDGSSQTTLDAEQRTLLEARLSNLSALLEKAGRLDGPWIERLAKFQQPIEEAQKAVEAAKRVIELDGQLRIQRVRNRRDHPYQEELSRIYHSKDMSAFRGSRPNQCSPQKAVGRFKSYWEGQLQAAHAKREEYIQAQVKPYQAILNALISQTKRDLGHADDATSEASSQLTPEKIDELIGKLTNDTVKAALVRYRETLLNE